MNLIDKKILTLLDENSRRPSSEIAKKLKLSRQVVEYRINKLVKDKVILNFTSIIDPTKFVNNIWHVYLKLQNLTISKEKEIVNYLTNNKEIWWVAKCQGEWDLVYSIVGDDIIKFDKINTDFKSKYHKYINEQTITSFIKADHFPRGYFLNKPTKKQNFIGKRKTIKIDEKDISILKILATNSRMPSTKIAEKTNFTARQVIYRIKELEKRGVIKSYNLHLNFRKLKYDYYKVCFYTQNFTESSENSILSWCETCPNVLYYVKKISPWTFELEFETEDYKQLNKILQDLRNQFGTVIKRTETTLILEEFKGELDVLRAVK